MILGMICQSLSAFDEILLLDIISCKRIAYAGITSEWLLQKMTNEHKELVVRKI
jgi:UDP-N-acetylmuramate--alanine ligase